MTDILSRRDLQFLLHEWLDVESLKTGLPLVMAIVLSSVNE